MGAMQSHHLLFDRRWLCWDHGPWSPKGALEFRLHKPAKLDQPLLIADKPWEAMSTGWHTVLHDQGRYRCWYEAWDETYKLDFEARLCYAESDDGLTWRKPELGLVEYRGSKQNNILLDLAHSFHGFGFTGHCVFVDPTASGRERYKMLCMGAAEALTGDAWLGVVIPAWSADGLRWECPRHPKWNCPPTWLGHASDTQTVAWWDTTLRRYVGYFRSWEPGYGRVISRAETNDFFRWAEPDIVLRCDHLDAPGVELYSNAANRYASSDDLAYLLFPSVYDGATDTLHAQLATSRDGRQFARLDRSALIAHGPQPHDRGGIYVAPTILPFRDGLAIPYHGVPYKHADALPDKTRYAGALCFATQPRDRFQGVHAAGEAEFCLQGFRLEGDRLDVTVNAVVEPGGEIRAAFACDHIRPGMGFEDCAPITGNQVAAAVVWRRPGDLRPLVGKPSILRFRLRKATLYAVTVRNE
jgi:hypothetical protein